MQTFTTDEVSIPHGQLVALRKDGRLTLGINNEAAKVMLAQGLGPKKSTADVATHLFSWVAIGVFIASIVLSFTWHWWVFIPGFFLMRIIWGAAKAALPDNYLDAAFFDEDFYERGRSLGVWLYQLAPEDAHKYTDA